MNGMVMHIFIHWDNSNSPSLLQMRYNIFEMVRRIYAIWKINLNYSNAYFNTSSSISASALVHTNCIKGHALVVNMCMKLW
jgi:hypothetical protein